MLDAQRTPCAGCVDALHLEAVLRFGYGGARWWLAGPLLRAIETYAAAFDLTPQIVEEGPAHAKVWAQMIRVGESRLLLRCRDSTIAARFCCREERISHVAVLERIVRATQPATFDVYFCDASRGTTTDAVIRPSLRARSSSKPAWRATSEAR